MRDKTTRKISYSDDVKYPIMIDADVTANPAAPADDGTDYYTTGSPKSTLFTTLNSVWVSYKFTAYANIEAYTRFPGITIPIGTTISDATLKVFYKNLGAGGVHTIQAFDENNPAQPTAAGDIRFHSPFASNVLTTNFGLQTAFTLKDLDVQAIVQELVTSFDYNNEAMLFSYKTVANPNIYAILYIYAYDQGVAQDAQLVINFAAAPAAILSKPFFFR